MTSTETFISMYATACYVTVEINISFRYLRRVTWQSEITKAEDLPYEILPLMDRSKVEEITSNTVEQQSLQLRNPEAESLVIPESAIDVEPPSSRIHDTQLDSWENTTEEESAAFWGDSEETSFLPESEQNSDQVASDLTYQSEAGSTQQSPKSSQLVETVECSSEKPESVMLNSRRIDPRCESDHEDGGLLVVNDTDESELEENSSDVASKLKWEPAVKRNPFPIQEKLCLTFEEVRAAVNHKHCLLIVLLLDTCVHVHDCICSLYYILGILLELRPWMLSVFGRRRGEVRVLFSILNKYFHNFF